MDLSVKSLMRAANEPFRSVVVEDAVVPVAAYVLEELANDMCDRHGKYLLTSAKAWRVADIVRAEAAKLREG